MNRAMKKTVSNVCALKIPRKLFCSEGVKVGGSTTGDASNEHEKKQIISKIIPQYDIGIVGESMPMTKQLNVAIIDSNPALGFGLHIKKEDPPDPRVSTVTTASISFFQDAGAIMQDSDFKTITYPLRLSSMTLNTSSKSIVVENTKSVEPSAHGAKLQCNLVMEVAYMLSWWHTNSYATKLVVVIGDAAHTVHPLTAQGVNLRIALGTVKVVVFATSLRVVVVVCGGLCWFVRRRRRRIPLPTHIRKVVMLFADLTNEAKGDPRVGMRGSVVGKTSRIQRSMHDATTTTRATEAYGEICHWWNA
ncbi:hypothetical protein ACSQ67_023835 [Phaseolus vulgaris]